MSDDNGGTLSCGGLLIAVGIALVVWLAAVGAATILRWVF